MIFSRPFTCAVAVALAVAATLATASVAQERGPVTNLPLPRFVSMKASEANVRRGPSLTHRIDWIFKLEDVPLEIIAEHGHWRRVRDRDGAGGWVHYSLLSGVRTAIVEEDMLTLKSKPN
ncbi:MAG: SH3 domain-containing protein, partial [Pseudomonadota bacterium]